MAEQRTDREASLCLETAITRGSEAMGVSIAKLAANVANGDAVFANAASIGTVDATSDSVRIPYQIMR